MGSGTDLDVHIVFPGRAAGAIQALSGTVVRGMSRAQSASVYTQKQSFHCAHTVLASHQRHWFAADSAFHTDQSERLPDRTAISSEHSQVARTNRDPLFEREVVDSSASDGHSSNAMAQCALLYFGPKRHLRIATTSLDGHRHRPTASQFDRDRVNDRRQYRTAGWQTLSLHRRLFPDRRYERIVGAIDQ
jgi:hypothetical protein